MADEKETGSSESDSTSDTSGDPGPATTTPITKGDNKDDKETR